MAQTLCIKCGSECNVSSYCQLCREPLIFACNSCAYITEEKVHTDCRNAEVLAKTTGTKQEVVATTTASRPREEMVKAEPDSAQSYMAKNQDNKDFHSINSFVAGTAIWQSFS